MPSTGNREPRHRVARAGKPDQIGEIYVISKMLKLCGHYQMTMGTGRASYKAGPAVEKVIG